MVPILMPKVREADPAPLLMCPSRSRHITPAQPRVSRGARQVGHAAPLMATTSNVSTPILPGIPSVTPFTTTTNRFGEETGCPGATVVIGPRTFPPTYTTPHLHSAAQPPSALLHRAIGNRAGAAEAQWPATLTTHRQPSRSMTPTTTLHRYQM